MPKYLVYQAAGLGLKWLFETRAKAEAHVKEAPADIDYRIIVVQPEEIHSELENVIQVH